MGAKRRKPAETPDAKAAPGRRLFALDQNFPEPIVGAMEEFIESAELIPVRRIHPSFSTLEDWELLLALNNHHREWDGLITSDAKMLRAPRVVSVLVQTKLTIVVAHGQGDNPVRATGVVLAHIDHICHNTDRRQPQVWLLGIVQKPHEKAWDYLMQIAQKRSTSATELFNKHKVDKSLIKIRNEEVRNDEPTGMRQRRSQTRPRFLAFEQRYSVPVPRPSVLVHRPSVLVPRPSVWMHEFPSW